MALDSVSQLKEPLFVTSEQLDRRTRLTLFDYNLELRNFENISAITAQVEDSQRRIYALPMRPRQKFPDLPG